jgi:adenosylmethionine-8-amino-7-oxononanoate aminotransferase
MVLRQITSAREEKHNVESNRVVPGDGSAVFHRDLGADFFPLKEGRGNYLILEDGRRIFDASGGAAVGCIGWGNERVAQAIMKQTMAMPYCATIFYTTKVQEELCRLLIDSTNGKMSRAYIVNSGKLYRLPCVERAD